ncbi:MAG: penicillin-binding protein activator [Ignavibacteriaceae bacterium]|nr:penicillin-binding protein activator [Ignavibacteriaceae bacterium]
MRFKYFLFSALFAFLMIGCNSNDNKSIKIGVDLPLSGKLSYYGKEVKNALTIVQKHNPQSGIQFVFEDNQSEASNSVTVFNKLAMDKNTPIIISCNSPLSVPLRPLAESSKKVLLALVTGARDFGILNKWSFRDAINQDQEGEILANYLIKKTDLRKGVTFVVNDDYGLGGASSFKSNFISLGGQILAEETFDMNERDLRSKIIKLEKVKPDFIFLVGREQTIISSIKQIREIDKTIPIITSDAFESPTVFEGLGELVKGIVFASYYNNFESEQGKQFLNDFKKEFGTKPGIYATDAYVAGTYLDSLINKSGNNSEKLQELLSTMKYDSPIKGKLYVHPKRDVISPDAVYKINENMEKVSLYGF